MGKFLFKLFGGLLILVTGSCSGFVRIVDTTIPGQTPGVPITASQAKYVLFSRFGEPGADPGIYYCDPDVYPIGRGDVQQRAIDEFPTIQKDTQSYNAILDHLGLPDTVSLTDQQKLELYQQWKELNVVKLTSTNAGYSFDLIVTNDRRNTRYAGSISFEGQITIDQQTDQGISAGCPICLPANALIDTPSGQVPIQSLKAGMLVWTADAQHHRIAVPIEKTGSVPVLEGYHMIRLQLKDGRTLLASPGHPTINGRPIGSLIVGDWLDGSQIQSVETIPYDGPATYDILPSSETGWYWADGVLVGSTLK